MKRINIQKDVDSRRNIASRVSRTEPITEPVNTVEADAESQDHGGSATDTEATPVHRAPSKRGRKTPGNAKEV